MSVTVQHVIAGVSDHWEFLLPMALSLAVVWDRLRWSKRQALAGCAVAALAFTGVGIWCGLTLTAIQPTFMVLMACMIPLFWRMSGLPFTRSLFVSATSLIPMMLCIDLSVIFNALMVGEDDVPLMQWPGIAAQWALTLALFALCARPMRRLLLRLVDSPAISERAWSLAWLVPFLSASLFTVLSLTASDIENSPVTALTFTLMLLLFTLLLVLFYLMLGAVVRQAELNAVAVEANRQLSMRQMQQDHLNERIVTARRMRHDLRQHMLAIRSFVAAHDDAGLNHYLDDMEAASMPDASIRHCDHLVANMIIVYYVDRARALGAKVDVAADIPANIALADIDLAVTLGNLLSNAVEALEAMASCAHAAGSSAITGCIASCEEPLALMMHASATRSGPLFLRVGNTYAGDMPDLSEPAVMSTKHAGAGLGMQSVRALAVERGGEVHFTADESRHRFTAEVVLPPAV